MRKLFSVNYLAKYSWFSGRLLHLVAPQGAARSYLLFHRRRCLRRSKIFELTNRNRCCELPMPFTVYWFCIFRSRPYGLLSLSRFFVLKLKMLCVPRFNCCRREIGRKMRGFPKFGLNNRFWNLELFSVIKSSLLKADWNFENSCFCCTPVHS